MSFQMLLEKAGTAQLSRKRILVFTKFNKLQFPITEKIHIAIA